MKLRILKLIARRPLLSLFVAVTLALSLVAVPVGMAWHGGEVDASANPRLLISRLWLDRYPDSSRDEVDLFLFFGSGFGIYEHGSSYKATMEFFEFERQGDKVDMTFFQDKKQHQTRFKVAACNDDDNFDLCLDFDSSPRGPKRYHSWGRDDEDAARIPWAKSFKQAAEMMARSPR